MSWQHINDDDIDDESLPTLEASALLRESLIALPIQEASFCIKDALDGKSLST